MNRISSKNRAKHSNEIDRKNVEMNGKDVTQQIE